MGLLALGFGLVAEAADAQTAPPFTASVSADTVEMGELFEFRVTVPVPAGSVVYFPDTLPATVNMESASPVRVDAVPAPDGSARLTLTYEMMAFGAGTLPVPGLDILMRARGDLDGVLELPGGSVTGLWEEAPPRAGSRVTRVPRQGVWVEPVFSVEQIAEGVEPMPANDVTGGSWSWPSLALMLLCGSLLWVAIVSTTRGVLEHVASRRGSGPPPTPEALRAKALSELDALLAERLHMNGGVLDFYTRTNGIVRRFVERAQGPWPSSLTSTELVERLRRRGGDAAAGPLPTEMALAEIVKFGRLRPDGTDAERHWRTLRDWVASSGRPS